jgi:hypothetical protein
VNSRVHFFAGQGKSIPSHVGNPIPFSRMRRFRVISGSFLDGVFLDVTQMNISLVVCASLHIFVTYY